MVVFTHVDIHFVHLYIVVKWDILGLQYDYSAKMG